MGKEYEYLDDYTVGEKFVSPARTTTMLNLNSISYQKPRR